MERILSLAGKNSGEVYQLHYPFSLLTFCDYDLTYFAENAIAVCDEALKSGELDSDRVTGLRNSLKNMHVYIEHNLRTIYDKIVLDCWIDYVCRRDGVGTSTLWNRFMDCHTAFEKAVFVRLCEYRYNKGINEWLNLVRVQDYAKNKVYFLFSRELSGCDEARARRSYFDLMFSVTARELGCRLEDMGVTQVYSAGRLPSSPFMYSSISKDVVKNVLSDFDYSEDYSDIRAYDSLSDQIAMDAFAYMKKSLPQELSSYNISRPAMENAPSKVYIPCGLKAAVDLEIDALLDSGGWLARCKSCGRYYVRDDEYTEEYCSLPKPGGVTCLEAYYREHPKTKVTPELEQECERITDDMYGRTTSGQMSLKEYESWKRYLEAMKEKVNNGEIPPEDLEDFIVYSETLDISRSQPISEVKQKPEITHQRVVKPFVPERISRSDLGANQQQRKPAEPVEPQFPQEQPQQKGFFTSPSVERQKSQTRQPQQLSHIIRADSGTQSRPYNNSLEQGFAPFSGENRGGFTAFGSSQQSGFASFEGSFEQNKPQPHDHSAVFGGNSQPNAPKIPDFGGNSQPNAPKIPDFGGNSQPNAPKIPDFGGNSQPNAPKIPDFGGNSQPKTSDFGGSSQPKTSDFGGNSQSNAPKIPDFGGSSQPKTPDFGGNSQSNAPKIPDFGGNSQPKTPDFGINSQSNTPKIPDFGGRSQPKATDFVGSSQPKTPDFGGSSQPKTPDFGGSSQPKTPDFGGSSQPKTPDFGGSSQHAIQDLSSSEAAVTPKNEPKTAAEPEQKPKIIRKNAAAMSAYGRISGTPMVSAENISKPEAPKKAESKPVELPSDEELFEGLDSIFDVLQQSESKLTDTPSKPKPQKAPAKPKKAPQVENKAENKSEAPADEPPKGIWTEERHLYDEEKMSAHEELNMLKEKKRRSSNKTQRLFDAIMKESADNPNVRKK